MSVNESEPRGRSGSRRRKRRDRSHKTGDLQFVLEAECTEEVARTSPGRYFSQLIVVIGGVPRR